MTKIDSVEAARAMGKLARGKRKTIDARERRARSKRMAHARLSRWPKKNQEAS